MYHFTSYNFSSCHTCSQTIKKPCLNSPIIINKIKSTSMYNHCPNQQIYEGPIALPYQVTNNPWKEVMAKVQDEDRREFARRWVTLAEPQTPKGATDLFPTKKNGSPWGFFNGLTSTKVRRVKGKDCQCCLVLRKVRPPHSSFSFSLWAWLCREEKKKYAMEMLTQRETTGQCTFINWFVTETCTIRRCMILQCLRVISCSNKVDFHRARRGYTNQVPFRPLDRIGSPKRNFQGTERNKKEDGVRMSYGRSQCNFSICLRWSWTQNTCTWPFLGPWRGTGGGEHRGSWVVSCQQLYFRSIWIETSLWPSRTSSINMPMHGPIGVVFVWAFAWHSSWLKSVSFTWSQLLCEHVIKPWIFRGICSPEASVGRAACKRVWYLPDPIPKFPRQFWIWRLLRRILCLLRQM